MPEPAELHALLKNSALAETLGLELVDADHCRWQRALVEPVSQAELETAAWLVADRAVAARFPPQTDLHAKWRASAIDGEATSAADLVVMRAYVDRGFGQNLTDDHIQGYVAEWVWYILALEARDDDRNLLRVEPPGEAAHTHGGDGLCVYDVAGDLSFRLWEIKKVVGSGTVNSTVTRASRQLSAEGLRYLAQYSTVASERGDLADFYAILPRRWADHDAVCGVGVAVSCSASKVPDDCFRALGNQFPQFNRREQIEGVVTGLGDFKQFADLVRSVVWKGL